MAGSGEGALIPETIPRNAIIIHTTLVITTGQISRSLDTSLMIQTPNWAEVTRAINDCWDITMKKAVPGATPPVPPGE